MEVKGKLLVKVFNSTEDLVEYVEEVQRVFRINIIELKAQILLLDVSPLNDVNVGAVEMPEEVREAYATKLNNDPFGFGCAGKTLEWIRSNCADWWNTATQKLKNIYIRERMRIIENYENGGDNENIFE